MINIKTNKFADHNVEQEKGGADGEAAMMIGRSLSKYSNISKISMN